MLEGVNHDKSSDPMLLFALDLRELLLQSALLISSTNECVTGVRRTDLSLD